MSTTIADIPNLTQAYAKGSLKPLPASAEPVAQPSTTLNDKVCLWKGDITSLKADGIQNAANSGLRGGGGIDGAIHRAAGPELLKACRKLGGCKTGNTKVTEGYQLSARYVLHTVGPIYDEDEDEECKNALESCYKTTLQLAKEHDMRTVALCGVSTGVYGFPLEDATEIALATTRRFLDVHGVAFERIIFCNFGERDVTMYAKLAPKYFPPTEAAADGKESPDT